ncbi:hypothetical protein HHI36_021580 [Cryptolaemus montrouzieri]|uniref:FAST kinase domain-containing protein 5 n=1 Tax=Cryptolaemus montrouzieri TaxID=559131 RepID=A0ABD2MXI7_9CUCU
MSKIIFKTPLNLCLSSSKIPEVRTLEEFENVLNRNYKLNSGCSATDILNGFKAVKNFCNSNQIKISDERFDNLVDGLMDHCEKLSDDEILELLTCLTEFPQCYNYQDHNFHDVWSCLDDISRERTAERDMEYLFKIAETWYKLHLGKMSDFIYNLIDMGARKAKKLSKDHIVKMFFFINVCRRIPVPFQFEEALAKYVKELTIDELGIVALGYFKSMSKIKITDIVLAMMEAVKKEASTVNQITLAALLKVIRFSKPGQMIPELNQMLDSLVGQIDRLSPQCCLHIAIIGSSLNHFHKPTMEKSIQKFLNLMDDVEQVRLKDLERIVCAATIVDFRPNVSPDLLERVMVEIHKDQRQGELSRFPRILPNILHYLSIWNLYSHDLMDRVLDMEYIVQTYGKGIGAIHPDILSLDCCIDLECSSYKGNRLPPKIRYKLAKWVMETTPSIKQYAKLTAYDKLYLDAMNRIISVVGDEKAVKTDHVAPHFSRADILLCKDKASNKFIEPPGLQRYVLGDLKYALEDPNLTWYAVIVVGWNNTIRCTSLPVGLLTMKQRHLRKLGYHPRLVIWNQYLNLSREVKNTT